MSDYQLIPGRNDAIFLMPGWQWIPNDPNNPDWQEYQRWLQAGNHPTDPNAPPPLVVPPAPAPTTLAADPVSDMDAVTRRYLYEQLQSFAARNRLQR